MEFAQYQRLELTFIQHFKIICQFFVHLALQPAEQRDFFVERVMQGMRPSIQLCIPLKLLTDEEYFAVPLQVVRRKLDGLRDSAVTSSVWKSDFKRPLETLPNLELYMLEFAIPECDACNLGSRVSTRCAKVTGAPYDKSTYEVGSLPIYRNGYSRLTSRFQTIAATLVPTPKPTQMILKRLSHLTLAGFVPGALRSSMNLITGRQVFTLSIYSLSVLTPLQYHLYRAITQEIDPLRQKSKRKRGFVRVAYAGGKQPPDDLDDADAVCQWLDERGIISMEWKKMQDMMESARTLEIKGKDGEDD